MKQVTDLKYWMDPYLISALDTYAYNLKRDFDFVCTISGDGMVRVGKSVLAQQVAYKLAYDLGTSFNIDNVVFSSEDLMRLGKTLPKNSVIIYDEAREGLDSKRTMETVTKGLLDFFAECGMYNHAIIVVLPDYFELPKSIAVNRSECLINVFRSSKEVTLNDGRKVNSFERGYFEFYNRDAKRKLFIEGKKNFFQYNSKLRNFHGTFKNVYVVDEELYKKKKLEYLARDRSKKGKGQTIGAEPEGFKQFLFKRMQEVNIKATNIDKAKLLGVSEQTYYRWIESYSNDSIPKEIG